MSGGMDKDSIELHQKEMKKYAEEVQSYKDKTVYDPLFGPTTSPVDGTTAPKNIIDEDLEIDPIHKLVADFHRENEKPDMVDHPPHYNQGPIEVIDFIESQEHLGFKRLSAIKYICRSGKKDSKKQDLEKAIWYLRREMDMDGEGLNTTIYTTCQEGEL